MRRHRRAGLVLNVCLVLLLAAAVGAAYWEISGRGSTASAATRVATVGRGTVLTTVSASGSLEPRQTLSASFASSGTVKSIPVQVGQHVKKGQVLARLNAASARRALQAAWLQRRYDTESLTTLQDTSGTTDTALIQAKATLASSNASYYSAVD